MAHVVDSDVLKENDKGKSWCRSSYLPHGKKGVSEILDKYEHLFCFVSNFYDFCVRRVGFAVLKNPLISAFTVVVRFRKANISRCPWVNY